ncbi:hypothetical protein [Arthrobacter sp. H5]|uniref:hypothetical protein n=1 Tax=Arthrobacter sp. H5 TaxID=1267973 RepID=UPI00048198E4|nr:hypothetical protein [Arthrobacter sp. H5]
MANSDEHQSGQLSNTQALTLESTTPELQLKALIQVNPDMGFATVAVRGSLTRSNCDALIRMVARTSYLGSDLTISVDLSEAQTVHGDALSRLGNYPTWMVIGQAQR